MSILEWAKKEVALANHQDGTTASTENEDTMDDYVSGCYASALKALSALAEDGHSGMSIGITMSVLNRLVAWKPLTPITEEDFVEDESDIHANPEWLKEQHLKSSIHARRYYSLERKEHEDGSITYYDYDREYCIDVNDEHEIPFSNGLATKLIHELYPISLPYMPSTKNFLVYMDRFLTDVNYGDYDTVAILGIRTPEGDKLDIKRYYKDTDDGMVEITEQEFLSRKQRSLSPDQIKLERAARRVVRDYIKEHYDDEDIIPGAIEMIRRKPTEHGWMWLFGTPQDSYMDVRYDSEESLFRVSAFEYENGSQVNADEVLHPHLNSRTKS